MFDGLVQAWIRLDFFDGGFLLEQTKEVGGWKCEHDVVHCEHHWIIKARHREGIEYAEVELARYKG